MDTDGESPPPFWFQPPMTPTRSYRRSSSPIINPVVLIILLPILALLLIFVLLPPFLSHASFIFRPNSVKKSWDSINIFLVFFAILCGVLARRNDDNSSTDVNHAFNDSVTDDDKLNPSVPNRWFEDSDRKFYTSSIRVPETGVRRLRRNSSYPDLKQESSWETGDNVYRFYDDFEVNLNLHRSANLEYANHRVRQSEVSQVDKDESDVKVIPVDTFQNRSSPPRKSPSPPPAPPPPPPPPKNLNRRRTYRSIPKQDKVETRSGNDETEFVQVQTPPAPPPAPAPPPPPPPPPAAIPRSQHKREKSNRKKSSATKDIATTIASLYNQTKRKRKHKTRNIYDNATQYQPSTDSATPPAPPPPPPPPPSVFHNMFRKGIKSKRIHSLSTSVPPPPPPPPPPPGSIFNNLFKNSSKSKRFSATIINSVSSAPPPPPPPPPSSMHNTLFKTGTKSKRFQSTTTPPPSPPPPPPAPLASNRKPKRRSNIQPPPPEPEYPRRRSASSGKPPLPTRANNYYERDEYLNSGAQSPLIPMPPPPPPFKMAEMKFMFRGDFVSISSNQSSRSTSPEREEIGTSSANRSPSPSYGGGSSGSGFCPSPDVNVKAATFIARLRDEWRAEKMNAVKEKQKMGPNPGPLLSPK